MQRSVDSAAVANAFWLIDQFASIGHLLAGLTDDNEIVLGPLVMSGGHVKQCSFTSHPDGFWTCYIELGDTVESARHKHFKFPESLRMEISKISMKG